MALFGTAPLGSTDGHRHYVEMKAGKMYRKDTWVYPEKRKGLLYLYQNSESLMHFCWMDRLTQIVVDDLIIFPGDCQYSRVTQCTTGRVYVLKFNNTPMRLFYWLQEPKTDKDDEHCKRINYLLNHPPNNSSLSGMYASNMLNDVSESQLTRIFGPNIAATLSSLMNQESLSQHTNKSNDAAMSSDIQIRHNTTPASNRSSGSDIPTQDTKKSNLKSAGVSSKFVTLKKKEKNVTIVESSKPDDQDKNENKDSESTLKVVKLKKANKKGLAILEEVHTTDKDDDDSVNADEENNHDDGEKPV